MKSPGSWNGISAGAEPTRGSCPPFARRRARRHAPRGGPAMDSTMTDRISFDVYDDQERYELSERSAYLFQVARRDFFKVTGAGLIIAFAINDALGQESGSARRGSAEEVPQDVDSWLHIGEDGTVTVYTGKVEVGQNARTSLTQ